MMNRTVKMAIDTRLANIKISNELERKIINSSNNTRIVRKKPFAIGIAAVICVMLSLSVVAANMTNFDRLLSIVSSQIAQNLQPIKLASEDNGIRMEVLAAMSDDDTAIAYISMQDLTADRVDKSIDFYNYNITGLHGFTSEVISYDKASKTAIVRLFANGGSKLNGKKVTVSVHSFLSDKQRYSLFDTGIDLEKVTSASTPKTIPINMDDVSGGSGDLFWKLKEQGVADILKTDEMNIALANIDFAHISNIGVVDGRLHVQTKWTGDGMDDHGTFALIDSSGHRIDPSTIHFGVDENGNAKFGSEYIEYIFEAEKSGLHKYKLNADYFTTSGNYVQGNWQTTFKMEAAEKGAEVDCDMNLEGIKINKVSVSPIGVSLIGVGNKNDKAADNANDIEVSVKMVDGSVLALDSVVSMSEAGKVICKYMPQEPVKVSDVKEVSINGNLIELK